MIIYEDLQNNLVKSYSDKGFYIRGGMPESEYTEAIDLKSQNRKYVETDKKITEKEATVEDYQQKLQELGVEI